MNPHELFTAHEHELRRYAAQWTDDIDAAMRNVSEAMECCGYDITLGTLYYLTFSETVNDRQPIWNTMTARWLRLAMQDDDVGFGGNATAEEVANFLAVAMVGLFDGGDRELQDEYYELDWLQIDWLAVATVSRSLDPVLKLAA